MDSPIVIPEAQRQRPTSVRRRVSMDSNSPEFEFWMVRNPSFSHHNLLSSADELFVDGVLLPLRLRSAASDPISEPDPDEPEPPRPEPEPEPRGLGPKITSSSGVSSLSPSKRWRDIFKRSEKEKEKERDKDKDKDKDKKEKKKERKSGSGSTGSAELNINIWPFSRSRSAGNACTARPKPVFGAPGPTRKANSAPCSRSNSAGESKSRKWPGSPARPGVHLGRSSPVWKVRRNSGGKGVEPPPPTPTHTTRMGPRRELPEKTKVLNLNVPICMGYRNQLSCRSDENSALGVGPNAAKIGRGGGGGGVGNGGGVGRGTGNLFNFRSLFTKKVY